MHQGGGKGGQSPSGRGLFCSIWALSPPLSVPIFSLLPRFDIFCQRCLLGNTRRFSPAAFSSLWFKTDHKVRHQMYPCTMYVVPVVNITNVSVYNEHTTLCLWLISTRPYFPRCRTFTHDTASQGWMVYATTAVWLWYLSVIITGMDGQRHSCSSH